MILVERNILKVQTSRGKYEYVLICKTDGKESASDSEIHHGKFMKIKHRLVSSKYIGCRWIFANIESQIFTTALRFVKEREERRRIVVLNMEQAVVHNFFYLLLCFSNNITTILHRCDSKNSFISLHISML